MGLVWVIITLALNTVGASAYAIHVLSTPNWPKKTGPSDEAKWEVFYRLTRS